MNRKTARAIIGGAILTSLLALAGGGWVATNADEAGAGAGDPHAGTLGKAMSYKPRFTWRSVRGRHWQIVSTELEEPSVTDQREDNRGDCPQGMVHVKGNMLLEPDDNPFAEGRLETMQLSICTDWISKDYPERCRAFDRSKWLELTQGLQRKPMEYCMDRFEYPNMKGQYPIIYVSWYEAAEMCEERGKRLCNEEEWTFACEGEEAKPYPYGDGYHRDPGMCITDQPWRPYNEKAMRPRDGESAGNEMDRLWRGMRSGEQTQCRSDMGVYDMTGNVDEWTRSVRPGERPSILKGGYWGPVRTRCRPSTRSHDQNHMFYQQSFRCCADAGTKLERDDAQSSVPPLQPALE